MSKKETSIPSTATIGASGGDGGAPPLPPPLPFDSDGCPWWFGSGFVATADRVRVLMANGDVSPPEKGVVTKASGGDVSPPSSFRLYRARVLTVTFCSVLFTISTA